MNPMLPAIPFGDVVSEPSELIARRKSPYKKKSATVSSIPPDKEDQLTYYSVSMCHVVQSALWRLGGDIQKVSEMLSIPVDTLNMWKRKFPEFKTACAEGIRLSTIEIEKALRGCAVPHDEVTTEDGPDGTKTTRKCNVVDTRAAIAVLKAKGDADWKDSKKSMGGITGNTIKVNINHFGTARPEPTVLTVEAKPLPQPEDADGSDDRSDD